MWNRNNSHGNRRVVASEPEAALRNTPRTKQDVARYAITNHRPQQVAKPINPSPKYTYKFPIRENISVWCGFFLVEQVLHINPQQPHFCSHAGGYGQCHQTGSSESSLFGAKAQIEFCNRGLQKAPRRHFTTIPRG